MIFLGRLLGNGLPAIVRPIQFQLDSFVLIESTQNSWRWGYLVRYGCTTVPSLWL